MELDEIRAQQMELIEAFPVGVLMGRMVGEWIITTPRGYATGASLGEVLNKAEHRGLLE